MVHRARRTLNVIAEVISLMIALNPRHGNQLRAIRRRIKRSRKRLSVIRDQQVIQDQLRRRQIALGKKGEPRLRQSSAVIQRAASACCTTALNAVKLLPSTVVCADDGHGIRLQIARCYLRARKRAQRIALTAPAERFHRCRKAVRKLALVLNIMGPPANQAGFFRRLRKLTRLLGRERDLLLMKQAIAIGHVGNRLSLRGMADERKEIRRQALGLARRIFAHGGKRFLRKVGLEE